MSDIETYDPNEYPTSNAYRLVTEAHTKMCVACSELDYPQGAERSDEIDAKAEEVTAALADLFDLMAEERGFNDAEFGNVFMDRGSEVWESD